MAQVYNYQYNRKCQLTSDFGLNLWPNAGHQHRSGPSKARSGHPCFPCFQPSGCVCGSIYSRWEEMVCMAARLGVCIDAKERDSQCWVGTLTPHSCALTSPVYSDRVLLQAVAVTLCLRFSLGLRMEGTSRDTEYKHLTRKRSLLTPDGLR